MTKVFSILVALLLACSSCDAAAPAPLTSWEFQWSQKENKLGTAQLAPESALPSEKGWKRIKLPFNPPKRHDGRYLWLRVALPHFDAMQDAALYISSVELFADFYLNGQRIYRSEPEAGPLRSLRFRGWNPHLLSLPPEASGKILYVHVFSNHANIGFSNNILLGPSRELIKTLFLDEIDMFVVGVLCWLAVLLQLILFASNPRVKYYIFSALFCASLGCYDFVFYKGTKYFFAGIANGLYTFEAVTFIAMPTTFFMLISHEFKTRAKILAKALTAGGALLFVILCLSIFGRGDLRLTLITWNSFLWIFGTIVIIGICPFEYRKRDTDTRIIIVGMILMLLLAGNAILVTNNMVHWKVKLTSASHLAFVITLVMVALRKFFAEH